MPDAAYEDPRLVAVYDALDGERSDLDAYLGIVDELGARAVLDVGCGTGTFPCLLAERGIEVIGVDPAGGSLDLARRKPFADRVRWIHGDATALPSLQVDLVTMTGNVAQVFVTDDDWAATLRGVHAALRDGGQLVFETRDPERRAWSEWDRDHTYVRTDVPGVGPVHAWCEVTDVSLPLVSFRWTYVLGHAASVVTSDSTLRFRGRGEVEASLLAAGFVLHGVRDAPDRPGRELVFVATRPS